MNYLALALLFLLACTQPATHTIQTPTAAIVTCDKRSTGEACDCGCLKPTHCINETCLLTNLDNGEGCVHNQQCTSGYCENLSCAQKTTPARVYPCERVCNTADRTECTTSCGFGHK